MQRRQTLACLAALLAAGPVLARDDEATPDAGLARAQGEWMGTLTYRDYSRPDRMVTLPTRMFAALAGPGELVLHFVFDDGPGKTVHSYDRMQFDFTGRTLTWFSGDASKPPSRNAITAAADEGGTKRIHFERPDGDKMLRYALELSATAFTLSKQEVPASGEAVLRNRFEFRRPR